MPFWPFRRRSRSGADDEAPEALPAEEGAPVPAPDSGAAAQRLPEAAPAPPARPSAEWRGLPPLRPSTGPFPLTAPVQRIREGLAVERPPDLALAPLGHLRSEAGPIGLVHGVLQPTAGTHPAQHTPSEPLDVARRPAPAGAEAAPAVAPLRRAAPAPQRAPEGVAPAAVPAAVAPSEPTTPAEATVTTPAARTAPAAAPAVGTTPVAAPAAPVLPAVPTRVAPAVPSPPAPPVQRAAEEGPGVAGPSLPVVQRHDLRESEPLPPVEPEQAQRAPEAAPSPSASPAPQDAPLVGSSPLGPAVQRLPAPDDAGPVRHAPAPAAPAPGPGGAAETPGPSGVQRLPDASPPVPVVGQRTVTRRRLGEPLRERPESMVRADELPVATTPQRADALPVATAPQRADESSPVAEPPAAAVPPPGPLVRRLPAVPADQAVALRVPAEASVAPAGLPPAPLVGSRALHPSQRLAEHEPVAAEPGAPAAPTPAPSPTLLTAVAPPAGPTSPPVVPVRRTTSGPDRAPGPPPAGGGRPQPPVQRAPGPPPAGAGRPQPPAQRAPEGVPAELRRTLEPALGADFAATPVHRGDDTDQAARQLQAKAFAVGGEVHLPSRHGSTESGDGKAILAHELTHIAQQQRLGSSLPSEDSPEGQRLETEAREVAGAVSQPQRLPEQPLTHLSLPSVGAPAAQRLPAAPALPPAQAIAVAQQVQRAALDSGIARPTEGPGLGVAFSGPPAGGDGGGPVFVGEPQRLPDAGGSPVPGVQRAVHVGEISTSVTPSSQQPAAGPPDVDSWQPDDIESFLDKVFPRLRLRLRHELLVQRERAGTLHDFR